jgi:hypothetical protein
VAGINGEIRPLEQLVEELTGRSANAIAVIGDLGAPGSKADTYRTILAREPEEAGEREVSAEPAPR